MYIELAKRNLKRHLLRSILALLGIVIGVAAITTLGILGESVKTAVNNNLGNVANYIIIFPNFVSGYEYFDKSDLLKLRGINGVVIPMYERYDNIYLVGKNRYLSVRVFGINKNDIKYTNLNVRISDTTLAVDNYLSEIGDIKKDDIIKIRDIKFRVSGIFNSSFIVPQNSIVLTEKTYKRLYNPKGYTRIVVYVKDINKMEEVEKEIDSILNKRKKKAIIISLKNIVENIKEAISKISYFIIAIGAISLLVAGIGIGNVMLMSVIERTKEIGIMRSIGASKLDILILFLLEAGILGFIGSVVGVIISLIISYFVSVYLLKVSLPLSSILYIIIGIIFGVLTSLLSSLYPAYKATKVEPIKALRND
ncbi:ABC transporter permease [Methanocaldococcus indicus]|uniref:ABC transporter permease n=1 Tax=Methanocaldococcus indicus TaxID=213231 RepID=UPI003C6D8A5C